MAASSTRLRRESPDDDPTARSRGTVRLPFHPDIRHAAQITTAPGRQPLDLGE
jgi:hypothetical protein